jgi:hypothetical protein
VRFAREAEGRQVASLWVSGEAEGTIDVRAAGEFVFARRGSAVGFRPGDPAEIDRGKAHTPAA